MDILLLPPTGDDPASGAGAPRPLHQPPGEQRLWGLIAWLIDRGELGRLYAFLPEAEPAARWTLDCLEEAGRKLGVEVSLLLRPERLTVALLETLHARGVLDLVLTGGSGGTGAGDASRAALAAFDRYRAGRAAVARSGRGFSCRLWLDSGEAGDDYQRLAALARAAPGLAIDSPAFRLPVPAAAGRRALPEALLSGPGGCRLFELSLTIGPDGRVWICPLHGGVAEGRAGDLFADTPEELLARKEAARARIGRTIPCRRCGVRGRFAWPESAPPRLAAPPPPPAQPQPAETAAAATPGPPDRQALTPEVAGDDPQRAERALADFEASLEAWSSGLADWETDGQS
jgi:hypothetical protein